jgi:hypothetical protein
MKGSTQICIIFNAAPRDTTLAKLNQLADERMPVALSTETENGYQFQLPRLREIHGCLFLYMADVNDLANLKHNPFLRISLVAMGCSGHLG